MAHSPSETPGLSLHLKVIGRHVTYSPVCLWLWAHIHHLPGILLCTLYDGIHILLQLIELSPLLRGMLKARPYWTLNVF